MALTKIKLDSMVTGNLPDANIPNNITISNAGTATALETARTINGTSFDGSANITVTSAAGTLTGNTLASGVTASSLTSVGTLSSLNVSGNAVISGSLQSDDITLDAGAGNPDLVIKTTASSSATAQALFLTGSHDFTLVNDTANFRLYNSTPGIGVDVIKVIGSSSDILFGDVGNGKHVSLDYSNGDFVVNKRLGVGAVPDSNYGGATIYGTSAIKTSTADGSELRFKLYTGGAADPSILQMFKADGATIGINLHSDGESYFKNSSHSVLTLEAGTNSSASLRLKNDAQHWDVNCQTSDNFALYDHTGGGAALIIESGGYNATFTGNVTISKSSPKMTIFASNAGSHESLVFDRNTASNGDSQEIKWKLQGSNYPGGYIRHTFIEAGNTKLDFGNRENGTVNNMMTIGAGGEIEAIKHSFISCAVSDRRGFLFKGDGGTSRGSASVQNSGYYGMVFGRSSYDHTAGSQAVGKSHWGGISIIGFAGSGVQGIDIVAWGYGNGGATVLKSGNWVGSLSRSYSTSNYHLMVNVGTDVSMWSILIGV